MYPSCFQKHYILIAGPFLQLSLLFCANADTFSARVISITDGDTVTVITSAQQQVKIRLHGIDAPESGQSFGAKSKQALSKMVFAKPVTVEVTGKDRYGRTIARLYCGNLQVNEAMVSNGWAWHYRHYSDSQRLEAAEQSARLEGKGLWADTQEPVPPWSYRRGTKKQAAEQRAPHSKGPYWLNTSGGRRHNSTCRYFRNTKKGRICSREEGSPCGICGG